MQCQRCHKKKAAVIYRENINGRAKVLRLCGDCTEVLEQAGELEDMGTVLSGFLSPLLTENEEPLPLSLVAEGSLTHARQCPACGLEAAHLGERGQLGCPACYQAFTRELALPLQRLHGRAVHTGRVSSGYRARKETEERLVLLRGQLQKAVEAEEYERAAALRDEIRKLEATLSGGV
jgi:protein arginine kinase activator